MKLKYLLPLAVVLTGCQTTQTSVEQEEPVNTVSTHDNSAGMAPEVKPVVKLSPKAHLDLWDEIEAGFTIPVPNNERITKHRNWYLKHPEHMRRVAGRAEPFMYLVVQEIKKRDMPLELALLPVVESAFDPFAYSHGGAAGMWQIISSTGKRFGLEQDWWYDGRRDVIRSTNAALDYLEYLHKMMDGDWLHAIAAYNSGEGRVLRAIKKNRLAGKPADFWNLELPKETKAYVPKLLALTDLLSNSEQYNINVPPIANTPVLAKVETGAQIDLAYAAELAEMELQALHLINPAFNRWATSPNGPHELLVPVEKAENFALALAKIPYAKRVQWQRYKIQPGDSLGGIANKFGTQVKVLKSANNLSSNNIRAGKYLLIPSANPSTSSYQISAQPKLAKKQHIKGKVKHKYKVKSGDTLWQIARQYKVSYKDLARWNGISTKTTLKLGQELIIWQPKATASKTSTNPNTHSLTQKRITYTVRSGDSLSTIAAKFKLRVADVIEWNKLNSNQYLQPGQKLKLFVDVTDQSA